jgi:DNA repair exonuclease SbcCD ATPase subunit
MLKSLNLNGVGPAGQMTVEFGERVNVITGDNGLGKSFLLDIAFGAMTRRWPGEVNPRLNSGKRALPRPNEKGEISFEFTSKTGSES